MTYPTKILKLVTSQELLDLYKTGMTLEEIGQYFGVTGERIRQKLNADPLVQGQYRTIINQQRAAREYQRNEVLICGGCGKEFKRNDGRNAKREICSRACLGKYIQAHPSKRTAGKIEEEQSGYKKCLHCQQTKPISGFYPKYGYKKGTRYNCYCKKCQYAATQNWQARNPERVKASQKRAVANYRAKVRLDPIKTAERLAYQRAYYQKKKLSK